MMPSLFASKTCLKYALNKTAKQNQHQKNQNSQFGSVNDDSCDDRMHIM